MSMSEGGPHALRSQVEPAYLGTADPGYNGGGTVLANDPQRMMSNYENIFGPAVRDIKWDEQRHKRHQRWHLPDALKGTNSFLTDRVDGLITDSTSSPFTKNILPYEYMENPDKKIKWNVYSFDEGVASRVPYEAAARVLPQSKRSFAGYAVRQGLAIAMEHNFMMSPAGMDNFRKQLMQLVGSIQLTNDLDVHMALLYAPSYQKHMDEKYFDSSRSVSQNCRMYVDLFGFMQKNENALDYLIEDAKNHLTAWGSKPPTFMLCNGALTRQLTMTPEKTNYITAGPDGKRKLAQGPDLPSYRGLQVINTRQFSLEAGTAPRDMLRRRVRVCEHYRIPWELKNLLKRYEFYDQSRDSMFYLSWDNLWKASFPQTSNNLLAFMEHTPHMDGLHVPQATMGRTANSGFSAWVAGAGGQPNLMFSTMLSWEEFFLATMLGIFGNVGPRNGRNMPGHFPLIERDLEFVVEILTDDKPRLKMFRLKAEKANGEALHYCFYMILLKLFLKDNFPLTHGRDADTEALYNLMKKRVLTEFLDRTAMRNYDNQDANGNMTGDVTPANAQLVLVLQERTFVGFMKAFQTEAIRVVPAVKLQNEIPHVHGLAEFSTGDCSVKYFASDLFVLRPCIEHYMLAVILGRGGGKEELGATFWGQTELSCYDDSQHGIWGMSYKYHERAIVTNERNLIRVFDVCFDGYCGGNDGNILAWDKQSLEDFKSKATSLSDAYTGPSMLVMALPPHTDAMHQFPNPLVLHTKLFAPLPTVPERNLRSNNTLQHAPFLLDTSVQPITAQAQVYAFYYHAAGMHEWTQTHQAAGHLAYQNETDPYMFSFHGHMATILDGQREETQGSGHLGPNFVGVASVREGRGMMPRGMPTLAHLV